MRPCWWLTRVRGRSRAPTLRDGQLALTTSLRSASSVRRGDLAAGPWPLAPPGPRADSASVAARRGDTGWGPLYRAGAVAAAAAVLLYVVGFVVAFAAPTAATSGGAALLQDVTDHRTVYIVRQLVWLLPSLLLMVVFLALVIAVRGHGRALAAVAGMVAVSSWAISFAWPTTGDGSLAMVVLSDRYAAATTDAARASYVAGAELLSALNNVPAAIGVLETLGILLVAVVMLRGTFGRGLAMLGVVTGAVGIVSEILRPVMGAAYAGYGVLLFVWLTWVAAALWRLADRAFVEPAAGEVVGVTA